MRYGNVAIIVTLFVTFFITLIFTWGVGGPPREKSFPSGGDPHGGPVNQHGETGTPVEMKIPKITATPGAQTAQETPEAAPQMAKPTIIAAPTSTPAAAAAADIKVNEPGYEKAVAAGQPGVAEVAKIGKNPLAGGSPADGQPLYSKNCASCHGESGTGDGPAGAALDPKPRNLTAAAEYKFGAGDLAVFRTIKYGVEGTGMAPWDGRMSDDEMWKVTNYVKSIQK